MSGAGERQDRARRGASQLASIGLLLLVAGTAGAIEPGASTLPAARQGNDLDRLVDRLGGEEKAIVTELAAIGPKLEITHRRMLARGRAYYRYVRAGLLPAGGGFDALVDHAARVERARMALERDLGEEAELGKRRTELEGKLLHLRVERAPLEIEREAMTRARTALAEVDERRAAFSRAFESSSRPPDYVAIYGADQGPGDADPKSGFRAMKGRLPFPIAGRAEVRKVMRPRAGGPGIELIGALGAPVRSVAAARVAFADRYDDYGLTVILDHGDHYYSLYANLGSADVRVGEAVASGARVGTMGGGPTRGGMLYFELRKGANTIDASPWLGL